MRIEKKVQCIIGGLVLCVMLLLNGQQAEAADTQTVTGTCEYDQAYKVLELVNEQRAKRGLNELEMDKDLLDAAMLRAAECVVSFSHTRPNGSSWSSACDKMYGENIAYGYRDASAVMNGWMNSQGHKENILRSGYTSIGIGCFYVDGVRYWAQCFGYAQADKISVPSNRKSTYKVALDSNKETELVTSGNPLKTKVSNFKATADKKKLTLKWKKKSGVDGYQLQISTSKNFKSKQSYNIGKNTTKKIITEYKGKKLKSNKKYYVRIRAYKKSKDSDGILTKKYSQWKTVNVKTK